MLNCQGNTLKRWNHEFPVRLHSNFKKAPEAVFLTQIATNSNPRAQSEVKKVCGITIIDAVADISFYVFDANQNENLSADEFIKVIQRRESSATREGMGSLLSCFWNCATKHSSTKLQS
ncbi:hypothetical protein Ahy_A05g025748 [Arachis hypogaea]|uniref:EF-hand domain-containing protein n=1 Tax=Arachis hypogaea TaxID=3818 RepID=A0A445D9E0_ARAHY|nr:hypothetical protein Ahy_A05g025748 [Arachis hypogaea]